MQLELVTWHGAAASRGGVGLEVLVAWLGLGLGWGQAWGWGWGWR